MAFFKITRKYTLFTFSGFGGSSGAAMTGDVMRCVLGKASFSFILFLVLSCIGCSYVYQKHFEGHCYGDPFKSLKYIDQIIRDRGYLPTEEHLIENYRNFICGDVYELYNNEANAHIRVGITYKGKIGKKIEVSFGVLSIDIEKDKRWMVDEEFKYFYTTIKQHLELAQINIKRTNWKEASK